MHAHLTFLPFASSNPPSDALTKKKNKNLPSLLLGYHKELVCVGVVGWWCWGFVSFYFLTVTAMMRTLDENKELVPFLLQPSRVSRYCCRKLFTSWLYGYFHDGAANTLKKQGKICRYATWWPLQARERLKVESWHLRNRMNANVSFDVVFSISSADNKGIMKKHTKFTFATGKLFIFTGSPCQNGSARCY